MKIVVCVFGARPTESLWPTSDLTNRTRPIVLRFRPTGGGWPPAPISAHYAYGTWPTDRKVFGSRACVKPERIRISQSTYRAAAAERGIPKRSLANRIANRAEFAGSPEFYGSAGGTPNGWITGLYDRILNRAPDDAGEQFWLNNYAIETGAGVDPRAARQDIALDFLTSAEEHDDDVTGWFREYLFRDPSAADLQASFAQLEVGATDRAIEQEIANSQKYAANPPQPPSGAAAPLPIYIELEAKANRPQGARAGGQTNNQAVAQPSSTVAAKDALFASFGGS